jgi:hypothetical protein
MCLSKVWVPHSLERQHAVDSACCGAPFVQAVEASQFDTVTNFHFVQNVSPEQAEDLFYRVESWGGGLVEQASTTLVNGRFK